MPAINYSTLFESHIREKTTFMIPFPFNIVFFTEIENAFAYFLDLF